MTTVVVLASTRVPQLFTLLGPGTLLLGSWRFHLAIALVAISLYLAALLAALVMMMTLPRLLRLVITPGRAYPLYGVRFLAQRVITGMSNSRFFVLLLGDSSFIVHFLRGLGYDLSRVQQTGSNFGTQLRHDSPFLTTVGTGTMVSDGLSIMNVEITSTSFRIDPVVVGERNFIGNNVAFPAGGRTGDNCLLATKVMIPIDGPVHQNTGLLGSPPFEIPRSSPRPHSASHPATPEELRRRLAAKNRYNARTVAVVLLLRSAGVFTSLLVIAVLADLWARFDVLAIATWLIAVPLILIVYSAVLERAVLGFRPLTPRTCSIYDRYFWHHERLWKFYISPALRGTPFTSLIWRLAGLRIGRRV
ncbi:MAG: Pls/PosA family non-ribosomal peptide synthetase, partial [Pseudonocardiaceae bacterium]